MTAVPQHIKPKYSATSNGRHECLSVKVGVVLSALIAAAFLASGCAQVRLLTYPAEFTYLDSDSVKGVMHEMAVSLGTLDNLVRQSTQSPEDRDNRPAILAQLQNIESMASSLSASTTDQGAEGQARPVTNHLLIDEHIDDFIGQIMRARLLAEAEPPNYYGVGQLTGNCNACHRLR